MGRVLALPCDQQTSEHADGAAVTNLPQLSIYAQLLQQKTTVPCVSSLGVPPNEGEEGTERMERGTNVGALAHIQ